MASQEVEINEEVSLTCIAEAFPRPFILWLFEGNRIPSRSTVINTPISTNALNSTLIIPSASLDVDGFYYCRADNTMFPLHFVRTTWSYVIVVGKLAILTLL